MLYNEELTHIH